MNIDTLNAHCGPWLVHCPRLAQGRSDIHRRSAPRWAVRGDASPWRGLKVRETRVAQACRPSVAIATFTAGLLARPRAAGRPRRDREFEWVVPLSEARRTLALPPGFVSDGRVSAHAACRRARPVFSRDRWPRDKPRTGVWSAARCRPVTPHLLFLST